MFVKSVYRVTGAALEEKIAESFDEYWALCQDGWFPHPEEARLTPYPEQRKPGRPKKDSK